MFCILFLFFLFLGGGIELSGLGGIKGGDLEGVKGGESRIQIN